MAISASSTQCIRPYVMVESKIIVTNHFVGWIYNPNNAVDVVWHHNKFAEDNFFADLGGFDPFGLDDFANFVKMHFFIEDGTEYTFPVMGADGDVCPEGDSPAGYEVCPFLGVVVALKAVEVATAGGLGGIGDSLLYWRWAFGRMPLRVGYLFGGWLISAFLICIDAVALIPR